MDVSFLIFTVPIVGIAAPVVVTWMVMRHLRQRTERLHQTVLALADRGMPVPAALLAPRSARSEFMAPLTLIGLGVGWAATCALIGDSALRMGAPLGILPVCVGVAQLIAGRLDRRVANRHDDPPAV